MIFGRQISIEWSRKTWMNWPYENDYANIVGLEWFIERNSKNKYRKSILEY